MNFLAHIYLSGSNPKTMVGNFIGDFVKGRNLREQFEVEIAKGIELHRVIDEYTDHHPTVLKSKIRLRPKYRHYAAVIVDVLYDHFLSSLWPNYHPEPLTTYSAQVYKVLQENMSVLPQQVRNLLPYMMKDNWLLNYGTLDGIEKALKGMARRTRYDSKMDESIVDLQQHYDDFKLEFEQFFPDLVKHSKEFLENDGKSVG